MSKSADGSERRTAHRRRRQRRAKEVNSAEILESMSDGFAAVDREWRYTYVNRAAERVLGFRREEMLGRTVWDLFPQEGTRFERALRRAVDEGVTIRFEEYSAPLAIWLENTVYPFADGVVVYARDITEHKRTDEALREQERLIRQIAELTPVVINVFDLKTFTLRKTITLSQTLGRIQGAKLLGGELYAFADLKDQARPVYKIDPETGHVLTVHAVPLPSGSESEGMAFYAQPDGTLLHTLDVTPDSLSVNLRDHVLQRPSLWARVCDRPGSRWRVAGADAS